jgi:exopolysaccharide production protein ExoZ
MKLIVGVPAAVMAAVSGDHCVSQAVPLRSIQILRAAAACLVVFGHALHETAGIAARTGRLPLNVNVIDWGIGVDIFFVISGFIMIYTTAELFGQPGAMRTFLMRRIIRIVPLYWLMTAGLILTYLLAPKMLNVPIEGWPSIVTSFFFIPDLRGNGEVRPIMALGWSLNYEMFFYAVFAVCLLAPLRRAALYLTGIFVGIAILGATLKPQSIALAYWTDSIVLEFLFGALLALACRAKFMIGRATSWALIALGAALAVALGPFWGVDQILPRCVSGGLPATLIVAAAAFGPRLSASWIVTPLVVLGDASYSLYLTHPFAIRPMRNIWMALNGGAPFSLYVVLCLLAAIAAALLVYRWIERPITDLLRSRLGSRGISRSRRFAGAQPQSAAAGG